MAGRDGVGREGNAKEKSDVEEDVKRGASTDVRVVDDLVVGEEAMARLVSGSAMSVERVRVDVMVLVLMSLLTPPGPEQTRPFWQHPYCPFEPMLQYVPTRHPPLLSGQHVAVKSMQPTPQSFWPCDEQESWREMSCTASCAMATFAAAKSRKIVEKYMIVQLIGICDA